MPKIVTVLIRVFPWNAPMFRGIVQLSAGIWAQDRESVFVEIQRFGELLRQGQILFGFVRHTENEIPTTDDPCFLRPIGAALDGGYGRSFSNLFQNLRRSGLNANRDLVAAGFGHE